MDLVLDIGNTRVQYALFDEGTFLKTDFLANTTWQDALLNLLLQEPIKRLAIASVVGLSSDDLDRFKQCVPDLLSIDANTSMPFENLYQSNDTIGIDRLALMAASALEFPKKNVLVIDIGTCITYDFKNFKNQYLGGSISLGVPMRYRALANDTHALPHLQPPSNTSLELIGFDTETAIHTGVIKGFCFEIQSFIASYQKRYANLSVVITGGGVKHLPPALKSGIFARPYFLLYGLYGILLYQEKYASND